MKKNDIKYIIETSGEGIPTIAITSASRKIYLHSKYNPAKEAFPHEKFEPAKYDMLIVLGAGLGYHLINLAPLVSRYKKIFIIDIIKNIETDLARYAASRFLVSSDSIRILSGMEHDIIEIILVSDITIDGINGIQVLEHPASMRIFSEYYGEIKKVIEKIISKKASDAATIRAFGYLYFKNILKNISIIGDFYPVGSFFGKFRHHPVLVVTSGPSLDGNIEPIRAGQDRCFIISVDSAIPALLGRGIIPDFCVSIDPQPYTCEHIIGEMKNTLSIVSLTANHGIVRRGGCILSLNSHPFCQALVHTAQGTTGSVDSSTGTVAGDAVMAAILFGFNAIGLLGFDFSFPKYSIYSRGSSYQNRFAKIFQNRFSSVETYNINYIMKASGGFRYGKKFTRKSFLQYKTSIEQLIINYGNDRVYNINSEGLPLNGTTSSHITDFINSHCHETIEKHNIISGLAEESAHVRQIFPESLISALVGDKEFMGKIIDASLDNKNKKADSDKIEGILKLILK
jgi:hypothetical protein